MRTVKEIVKQKYDLYIKAYKKYKNDELNGKDVKIMTGIEINDIKNYLKEMA